MRRFTIPAATLIALLAATGAAADDKVTRETFSFAGKTRVFFLYIPDTVKPDAAVPLLLALHGSGRDGASIVNPWKDLARKEGMIVVGPNSYDKALWDLRNDGPDFFQALVNLIREKHPVDGRRMYLFGHSAGAIQSLILGLLESEYFAAAAVHAGALMKENWDIIDNADRKIPLGIWVGTADKLFPMEIVTATRDVLKARGFDAHLRPINNHDHNYYMRSGDVNAEAWAFLQSHKLDNEPKFKQYLTR